MSEINSDTDNAVAQVSMDKSYLTKVHAKERSARYEETPELSELAMGGPGVFSP